MRSTASRSEGCRKWRAVLAVAGVLAWPVAVPAQVTTAPPNSGPIIRPMVGGTGNHTMAATIAAGCTLRSRISRPTGTISAPPNPCRMRKATSDGSDQASPHRAEPSEKKAIAAQNTRRAPKRRAHQPLTGRNTARLSR